MTQIEEISSAHFLPNLADYQLIEEGIVTASAPSNIALIKYWGKKEVQIATNSSLSFTLTNCKTDTKITFKKKNIEGFSLDVIFEGKKNEKFAEKIYTFFERIHPFVPFLQSYHFVITTENSFPHSSGIASSASGFAALAKCLLDIESQLGSDLEEDIKDKKISFLARLGSGSAGRSVGKGLMYWGENDLIPGANKRFAVEYPFEVAPVFKTFKDTILIIEEGQKQVSSTVGHGLMDNHPYSQRRFEVAEENLEKLKAILASGDLTAFGQLIEEEALGLHGLMMTSNPAFILMSPNTLSAIQAIWAFRKEQEKPLYFTLDAGANIHLLYPKAEAKTIESFIERELKSYCKDGKYLVDETAW